MQNKSHSFILAAAIGQREIDINMRRKMNVSEEISAYAQVLIPVWEKDFANELDSTFEYYKLLADIP